jgi:hypothetical protein
MDNDLYIVTYGELNDANIKTLVVAGQEAVRKMAFQFITVIPDDLDWYQDQIKAWKGRTGLTLAHQDDDSFYFSVVPGPSSDAQLPDPDMASFRSFVSNYAVDDG